MATEIELRTDLQEKQVAFRTFMDSFPTKKLADGKEARDIPGDKIEEIRNRNKELNDLGEQLKAIADSRSHYDRDWSEPKDSIRTPDLRGGGNERENRSLSAQLMEDPNFRSKILQAPMSVKLPELRTTMTTAAGFAPFVNRESFVVPAISKPLGLLDYVQVVPTAQNSTKFMRQSTRTNNAAGKQEATAAAESATAYTEVTSPIVTITHYLPVSKEQLEDEPGIRAIIDADLILGVRQILDQDITVGAGSPTLTGCTNLSGVQTQARGTDPYFDAIMKAMTKVRANGTSGGRGGRFGNPNLVLLHPTDYQTVVLERTADGLYILGNPGEAPMSRVWGVNVGQSMALTAGTGLVMDTSFMRLRLREDAEVFMTDAHSTLFINRVYTLRCDIRAGFEVQSDEAVCKVTGL